MKSKILFTAIAVSSILLVVAAGLLIRKLSEFQISGSPAPEQPVGKLPADALAFQQTSAVSEAVIDATKVPSRRVQQASRPADVGAAQEQAPAARSTAGMVSTSLVGKASFVQGKVYASNNKGIIRTVTEKSAIYCADSIEAAQGAKLKIDFDDGSTIIISENTKIMIDEFIYDPSVKENNSFAAKILKGSCRVVTGMITKSNPDKFKIRSRGATIGIRGCNVAIKTSADRDDIYIIELGGEKAVRIETTTDGSAMNGAKQGSDEALDPLKRKEIEVVDPRTHIVITKGSGPKTMSMTPEELRALMTETSQFPPSRHNIEQKADGAVFILTPPDVTAPANAGSGNAP